MNEENRMIQSSKLLGLSRRCPECGNEMQSTGKMVYQPVIGEWTIEYWCPNDQETFRIYAPETKALADEVAASEG